ncbi:CheY-like superfamily [Haematococcus lacustris]
MGKPRHFEKCGTLSILSVDDDPVNCMVIEQILRTQGWEVVSAQDGEEAMSILNSDETWPDFVFLDYTMNMGDNGDVICRKMRSLFGAERIPIVMCTAMSEGSGALNECLKAGASDVVLKPYDRERMFSMVKQYVPQAFSRVEQKHQTPPSHATAPVASHATPSSAHPSAPAGPAQSCHSAAAPVRAPPTPPSPSSSEEDPLITFFINLDLEYCGQKLKAQGMTMERLETLNDAELRKAGIVVKSQRDKILANIFSC